MRFRGAWRAGADVGSRLKACCVVCTLWAGCARGRIGVPGCRFGLGLSVCVSDGLLGALVCPRLGWV